MGPSLLAKDKGDGAGEVATRTLELDCCVDAEWGSTGCDFSLLCLVRCVFFPYVIVIGKFNSS